MTRLDRALLEKGAYPHRCTIDTRVSDLDHLGHVNNVAAGDLLQEARYRFLTQAGFMITAAQRPQLVVAAALIEYAADLFASEPVQVWTGILAVGRSSFRMGQVARQGARTGLYAEIVEVARDGTGATPIPDSWRGKLESLLIVVPSA
ncbi:MAG: acyl-CoA thioesterase [Proteobacteria bacterium]|nr:acyl-CoA thioesterase [Pseudomonadota bacterium]